MHMSAHAHAHIQTHTHTHTNTHRAWNTSQPLAIFWPICSIWLNKSDLLGHIYCTFPKGKPLIIYCNVPAFKEQPTNFKLLFQALHTCKYTHAHTYTHTLENMHTDTRTCPHTYQSKATSTNRVGINSGPKGQGPGTWGPKGNTKSQNTDSFITMLHYRRLCCIVVQVSNTIFLSLNR